MIELTPDNLHNLLSALTPSILLLFLLIGTITDNFGKALFSFFLFTIASSFIVTIFTCSYDRAVKNEEALKANGNTDIVCYEGNLFSSTSFFIRRGEWKATEDEVLWEEKAKAFPIYKCKVIKN